MPNSRNVISCPCEWMFVLQADRGSKQHMCGSGKIKIGTWYRSSPFCSYDNNRLKRGTVCFRESKWAGKVENENSEQPSHTEVVQTTLAPSLRDRLSQGSRVFFFPFLTHCTHSHTHSTSASPTFFFLMAYCRQWLRVLVNNRFVDLRIMSSTSVELRTHTFT